MTGLITASKTDEGVETKGRFSSSTASALVLLALILLNLLSYHRTLTGYFLADDFVHVAYLFDVFNGHPEKLLENFTGNWMHAWGTQFYRPLVSLSLAFDYLTGQGNEISFHVSNTVFHVLASFFLFLCGRRLLGQFSEARAFFTAFAAALIFSVCPLHTEVVSWVIGRVDGLCLALYLISFYFFLCSREKSGKQKIKMNLALGLFFFALSLLSKEMAVTLPPLLVLASLLLSEEKSLKAKLKSAFVESRPYWAMLLLYLLVRTLALGTLAGGYGGSVGEGLSGSFIYRFQSLTKLLFPFNNEVIPAFDRLRSELRNIYLIGLLCFAARLCFKYRAAGREMKYLVFSIFWFLLSLLPTYQVFNITDSLMCSRFAYFATMPFSFFIAILFSGVWEKNWRESRTSFKTYDLISIILTLTFIFVSLKITQKNNLSWAHAGEQVREFRCAVARECSRLSSLEKLVLLNIPQRFEGAHMIYNAAMLSVLLSEPLTKPAVADKVLSFEPPTYGDSELINASRLLDLINTGGYRFAYWDLKNKELIPLHFERNSEAKQISFDLSDLLSSSIKDPRTKNLSICSPELDLSPAAADFIVLDLELSKSARKEPAFINLSWKSLNKPAASVAGLSLPLLFDSQAHSYYFPVSEHKAWFESGLIKELWIKLPVEDPASVRLASIKIIGKKELMPEFSAMSKEFAAGNDGIYRPLKGSKHLNFLVDASNLAGAESVALELSRPNSWFEHYSGSLRDRDFSKQSLTRFIEKGNKVRLSIEKTAFPQKAYYELRAFALDKNGKIIGFSSDPVNLQID